MKKAAANTFANCEIKFHTSYAPAIVLEENMGVQRGGGAALH